MSSRALPPSNGPVDDPSTSDGSTARKQASDGASVAGPQTASTGSPPRHARMAAARAGFRHLIRKVRGVVRHPAWRAFARALARVALILLALIAVVMLLMRFVMWPQASTAKAWLEERGSAALSAKVTIGSLDTFWEGWHPAFRAGAVKVVDQDQRVLLAADAIDGQLSWRSLLTLDLQFAAFSAAQADLLVRRTGQGRMLVAGMPLDPIGAAPGDNRFLDWLLAQGKVDLSNGKVRWLDEKHKLPLLEVGDINLRSRREGARHTVKLEARSPALSPQPLVVQADFRNAYLTSAGDWRNWNGMASWNFGQLQLAAAQRYLAIFDKVDSGVLSTDGTIAFNDGHVARSQLRLRGSRIDLRLDGASEALQLANVQALLLHNANSAGDNVLTIDTLLWEHGARDSAATPPATDAAWREGMRKVTIGWALDGRDELRKFSLKAPSFDLNTARALATTLPVNLSIARQLRALQPSGHIDNLDMRWARARGGLLNRQGGKLDYSVQGTLRNVSVREQPATGTRPDGRPRAGVPGFTGLSGSFRFDDKQGSARFEGNGASLVFPGVFEEPRLSFDELGGELKWRHDKDQWVVSTDGVRFANADSAGSVRGTWRSGGDGAAGLADLSGELSRAQASRVPRYLPLQIPGATRRYLHGALVAGEARDVTFLVKGDLEHFPFHGDYAKAGDFRVDVPVHQVTYQIAPHETTAAGQPAWPHFEGIDGKLLFERGGMSFVAHRATVRGIPGVTLHEVNGHIAELDSHGRLLLDGTADGAMHGFLRYAAASPVREWIGHPSADARAQGNAELKLKLDMPMSDTRATRVSGHFRLAGTDLMLAPGVPTIGGANGTIAFDERGFRLENVRGRFLGGDLRLSGGTQSDGTVRVTAGGTVTGQGIGEALASSALSQIGKQFEGGTAYTAVVTVHDRQPQLTISSELNGMAIHLPQPLAKPAAQAVPLRLDLRPVPGRTGNSELAMQYGGLLNARYLLKRGPDGMEVQAGTIGMQQTASMPASGVSAALTLDRFDLDAWRAVLAGIGPRGGGGNAAKPAGGGTGDSRDDGPAMAFVPDRITARSRTLRAFGRDLDDVTLEATRATPQEGQSWQFRLDSRQIAGAMHWREDAANPAGAMTMRLSRLNIPDSQDESNVVDALAQNIDQLPTMDLVADHFQLRGHDLGKLEVKARSAQDGGEPVWTLEKLVIDQPGATLTGTGSWRVPRRVREGAVAQRRTLLSFQLAIRNAGSVLDSMGMTGTLRDGKGKLEGRVAWIGSPLSIDYATLTGRLVMNLENGQILSVEPGAAKLLGVLSLQGLMRIATLDFRGIAGEGLVFDEISATSTIENGIASTQDFRLKSPQVSATMTGSANIPRETQNLEVALVPRINATSASVAAAFVNPVLGIGTLAAQLLFADEFSKAFTQHYRVSGGWANPQVTKVGDNKPRIREPGERSLLQ
jgi:uncharacterized protein (TIGR02099 family)